MSTVSVCVDSQCLYTELRKAIISTNSIGEEAFAGCTALEKVTLSENLENIDRAAFNNTSNLVDINLPKSIKTLGTAFAFDCPGIKTIDLPNLETIGYGAFSYLPELVEVKDLGKITTLPYNYVQFNNAYRYMGAFRSCEKLEKVVLPETLVDIQGFAFYDDSNLSEINLPESIINISEGAFAKTTNLALDNINLPNLETIGDGVFYESAIKSVINLGKITNLYGRYTNIYNNGYEYVGTFAKCRQLEEVILPKTLTTIGEGAFRLCTSLKSIEIPESVEKIADSAFAYSGLDSIIIADGVRIIGKSAFYTTKITGAIFNSFVTSSSDNNAEPFRDCTELEFILLGENATEIQYLTFRGCTKLKTVIVLSTIPPTINSSQIPLNATIYVPDQVVETYKNATGWSAYISTIKPISALATDNINVYREVESYLSDYVQYTILPENKITLDTEIQLTTYYNGNEVNSTYSVNNDVATINNTGLLTFNNYGIADVTATYNNITKGRKYKRDIQFTEADIRDFGNLSAPSNDRLLVTFPKLQDRYEVSVSYKDTSSKIRAAIHLRNSAGLFWDSGWISTDKTVSFNETQRDPNDKTTLIGLYFYDTTNTSRIVSLSEIEEAISFNLTFLGSHGFIRDGVELKVDGTLNGSSTTMSTVMGPVICKPSTRIKWGVTGGKLGILCEYKEDGTFVDYWTAASNPREIAVSNETKLVRASFSTANIEDAYIYDVTNGVYLWKGSNVQ